MTRAELRRLRRQNRGNERKGIFDPEKTVDELIADGWPIKKWVENGETYFKWIGEQRDMTKEEKRKIRESKPKQENYDGNEIKVEHYDVDNDDLDYYRFSNWTIKSTGETFVCKEYYDCPFQIWFIKKIVLNLR